MKGRGSEQARRQGLYDTAKGLITRLAAARLDEPGSAGNSAQYELLAAAVSPPAGRLFYEGPAGQLALLDRGRVGSNRR